MVDLTPAVNAVISICAALLTVYLLPYIKEKYGTERAEKLVFWAQVGVEAAEQLYKDRVKAGDEKKLYVLRFLESKGFHVNEQEVEEAIESAVYTITAESEKQKSK